MFVAKIDKKNDLGLNKDSDQRFHVYFGIIEKHNKGRVSLLPFKLYIAYRYIYMTDNILTRTSSRDSVCEPFLICNMQFDWSILFSIERSTLPPRDC